MVSPCNMLNLDRLAAGQHRSSDRIHSATAEPITSRVTCDCEQHSYPGPSFSALPVATKTPGSKGEIRRETAVRDVMEKRKAESIICLLWLIVRLPLGAGTTGMSLVGSEEWGGVGGVVTWGAVGMEWGLGGGVQETDE